MEPNFESLNFNRDYFLNDPEKVFVEKMPSFYETPKLETKIKEVSKKIKNKQIRFKELESTLTQKMITPENIKRESKRTEEETGNNKNYTVTFINKTIKSAHKNYEKSNYETAIQKYSSVLELKSAKKFLQNKSIIELRKDLYFSYIGLWQKKDNSSEKLDNFIDANKKMEKYLNKETQFKAKKETLEHFSMVTSQFAESIIEDHHKLAFDHLKILLQAYLKYPDLIEEKLLGDLIDDTLHNMTVCISNQEDEETSNQMDQDIRSFLNHNLISDEIKNKYSIYLNETIDDNQDIYVASIAVQNDIVAFENYEEEPFVAIVVSRKRKRALNFSENVIEPKLKK